MTDRKPLPLLRDSRGNFNLRNTDGEAPSGYTLIASVHAEAAAKKLRVPLAPAVRYERTGRSTWYAARSGVIVPSERATEVATEAEHLESMTYSERLDRGYSS